MYLYFDSRGTLKEQINDEALRQGNSGVNKLYIYFENEEQNDVVWTRYQSDENEYKPSATTYYNESTRVVGQIPYDKKRDLKFFKYYQDYNFYVVDIPEAVLGIEGTWLCSIWVVKTGSITTLSNVAFFVEDTNFTVAPDENINVAQWNALMHQINGYVTKAYVDGEIDTLDAKIDREIDNLDGKIDREVDALDTKIDNLEAREELIFNIEVDSQGGIVDNDNPSVFFKGLDEDIASDDTLKNTIMCRVIYDGGSDDADIRYIPLEYVAKDDIQVQWVFSHLNEDNTKSLVVITQTGYSDEEYEIVYQLVPDNFVPKTRTINGKSLSSNITLDAKDIATENFGTGHIAVDISFDSVNGEMEVEYADTTLNTQNYVSTINGLTGQAVLDATNIPMSTSDQTTVKSAIDNVVAVAQGKTNAYSFPYNPSDPDEVFSNGLFNSQSDTILLYDNRTLYITGSTTGITGTALVSSLNLKIGDLFLVTNTEVPDRWVGAINSGVYMLYKLETTKVDLSGYALDSEVVKLTGNQTIAGNKTFTGITRTHDIYPDDVNGYYSIGGRWGYKHIHFYNRQNVFTTSEADTNEGGYWSLPDADSGKLVTQDETLSNSYSVCYNLIVNSNQSQFSGNYKWDTVTITGLENYVVKQFQTSSGNKVTNTTTIKNYLKFMTGRETIPTYNASLPRNAYLITTSENQMWKLQWDSTNGLLAFLCEDVPFLWAGKDGNANIYYNDTLPSSSALKTGDLWFSEDD